jgi:hypothetical protein
MSHGTGLGGSSFSFKSHYHVLADFSFFVFPSVLPPLPSLRSLFLSLSGASICSHFHIFQQDHCGLVWIKMEEWRYDGASSLDFRAGLNAVMYKKTSLEHILLFCVNLRACLSSCHAWRILSHWLEPYRTGSDWHQPLTMACLEWELALVLTRQTVCRALVSPWILIILLRL